MNRIRKFSAKVLFCSELGKRMTIDIVFSVKPIPDCTIEELVENYAIFEGYEYLHEQNIKTCVASDDGFAHEKIVSLIEITNQT